MTIRNKVISKVSSCSQTAIDVWLVSAYGIPTLFFSLDAANCLKNFVFKMQFMKGAAQKEHDHLYYFYHDKSLKLHMQMMPNANHKRSECSLDQAHFTKIRSQGQKLLMKTVWTVE